MASPQYVIGDSSPFLKRVLIPFWVLRILIMVIEIAVVGLLLAALAAWSGDIQRELEDAYGTGSTFAVVTALLVVEMVLVLICLILDIVCIIKRARRTLTPKLFFYTNLAQFIIWLIFFVLMMVGARSGLTIGLGIFLFLLFLGPFIYACVIFHQFRKGTLGSAYYSQEYKPVQPIHIQTNTEYPASVPAPTAAYPGASGYYDAPHNDQPQPYQGGGYEMNNRNTSAV